MPCCGGGKNKEAEVQVVNFSDAEATAFAKKQFNVDESELPLKFPMWVISAKDAAELTTPLKMHQDMKAMGLIKVHDPATSNNKVVLISHQWVGFKHPDPAFEQFSVLQQMLKSLAAGTLTCDKDVVSEVVQAETSLLTKEECLGAMSWDVWYDYFGVPQLMDRTDPEQVKDLVAAVNSIPAYIDLAHFVIVLAPSIKHQDGGWTCNVSTWAGRGWCLLEKVSCVLSRSQKPFLLCDSPTRLMSAVASDLAAKWPVDGIFTVEDDRSICVDLTKKLLARKCISLLKSGEIGQFRAYNALKTCATRSHTTGLLKFASTVDDFLEEFRFKDLTTIPACGFTPLMCATISGNSKIVKDLVSSKCDMEQRFTGEFGTLGMITGHTALSIGGAFADPGTLQTLMDLKANPKGADKKLGNDAIHMAAWFGNEDVIECLVKNKFDPNSLNNYGDSATELSTMQNRTKVVRKLCELKGDPNLGDYIGSSMGAICAMYCTDPEHYTIMKEFGFDPNKPHPPIGMLFKILNSVWNGKVKKGKASFGEGCFAMYPCPALFSAIYFEATEHVKALLRVKADPYARYAPDKKKLKETINAFEFAQKRNAQSCLKILTNPDDLEDKGAGTQVNEEYVASRKAMEMAT